MARKASGNPGMGTSGTVSGVLRASWGVSGTEDPKGSRGPETAGGPQVVSGFRGNPEGSGARES